MDNIIVSYEFVYMISFCFLTLEYVESNVALHVNSFIFCKNPFVTLNFIFIVSRLNTSYREHRFLVQFLVALYFVRCQI